MHLISMFLITWAQQDTRFVKDFVNALLNPFVIAGALSAIKVVGS